jgi:hypothetical protein
MSNMSDGTKDGLALFYIRDKTVYPVALTQEQVDMLDLVLAAALRTIKVVENKPVGKATNLINKEVTE